MMDERTHLDYLDDVLDAIEKIKELTLGNRAWPDKLSGEASCRG